MMTSPDYPCNYPNNVNFTWIIKPGKIKDIVNFTILDLQAETKNGRSCYDYLQVRRFFVLKLHFHVFKNNEPYGFFFISSVHIVKYMLKKNCYNRNDSIFTIKTKNFKKVYARITGISAFSKHAIMQFVDND